MAASVKQGWLAYGITLAVILLAMIFAWRFYESYTHNPWTRDAQVRAELVRIAPEIGGMVASVEVNENRRVEKNALLFRLETETLEAEAARAKAHYQQLEAMAGRPAMEGSEEEQMKLDLAAARTARDLAELRLAQAEVRAPANGYISELSLVPGGHVAAGQTAMVLIDEESFSVTAYFPETVLNAIQPGQRARVVIMGRGQRPLEGRVDSVAWGVQRHDTPPNEILPESRPVVDWIRLPQRFPVLITLLETPEQPLRVGQTVTVRVFDTPASPEPMPSPRP